VYAFILIIAKHLPLSWPKISAVTNNFIVLQEQVGVFFILDVLRVVLKSGLLCHDVMLRIEK
jgi:hypothetical protein